MDSYLDCCNPTLYGHRQVSAAAATEARTAAAAAAVEVETASTDAAHAAAMAADIAAMASSQRRAAADATIAAASAVAASAIANSTAFLFCALWRRRLSDTVIDGCGGGPTLGVPSAHNAMVTSRIVAGWPLLLA